jgi:glycosyltransferase involved in cell wall biosynthesis
MMFLHLLRWLRANTDLSFEILLLAGGPLADAFAEVAPTTTVDAFGRGGVSYLESGMARAGFAQAADRMKVNRGRRLTNHLRGFDALYLNSATSAIALRMLPELPPLVVSHIHEMRSALVHWFPEPDRSHLMGATDWFVACSGVVERALVDDLGVPADRVSCHHEFIVPPTPEAARTTRFRERVGIAPGALVVGGAGTITWRKGTDLFVQAAAHLRRRRPDLDVHFVWVGGVDDDRMPVEADAAKLGLSDRMHFVGELERPDDAYRAFDIFALTSREDPYPLVMLETASLAIPVVSFDNGGVVELAGPYHDRDARRAAVVDYLDVESLVDEIITLLDHPDARADLGRRGQAHVLAHHTVETAAPGLAADLVAHLEAANSRRRGHGRTARRAPGPTSASPPRPEEPPGAVLQVAAP